MLLPVLNQWKNKWVPCRLQSPKLRDKICIIRRNESPHFPDVQHFLILLLEVLKLLLPFLNNVRDAEEATLKLHSLFLHQLIFSLLGV